MSSSTHTPHTQQLRGPLAQAAAAIAARAHEGQTDKAGHPYINHPARVAGYVHGDDLLEAIAWLHDVVEDTHVTLDDLRAQFPSTVVAAVDALTHRADEDRDDYYARVRVNPLALSVKLVDLRDNSNEDRLAQLDPKTQERLRAKYAHARQMLLCGTGNV